MEQEKMGMEELKRVCEEKGIRVEKEKYIYILFGEGLLLDVDNKRLIVSENASVEDIKLATEYIRDNFDKI